MNIVIVFGTRPEAVKLAPVIGALRARGVNPTVVCTGQHTNLLADTLDPHVNLEMAGGGDPITYAAKCGDRINRWLADRRPDEVVVQGDTASAYAGAVEARGLDIPVVHIEAGVRSGDEKDPWPEEGFRQRIDEAAQWWYAATEANRCNVHRELWEPLGISIVRGPHARIQVTGNPGIDALYQHTPPYTGIPDDRVVVTLHRRESFGKPLQNIIHGICEAAEFTSSLTFWWPLHPNPHVREALDAVAAERTIPKNVTIVEPRSPIAFAQTLSRARAVITDSGGVQEEAAALGVPCVVARNVTDRPESVELGLAHLAGTNRNMVREITRMVLDLPRPEPSDCFGDGKAAPRIAEHLLER